MRFSMSTFLLTGFLNQQQATTTTTVRNLGSFDEWWFRTVGSWELVFSFSECWSFCPSWKAMKVLSLPWPLILLMVQKSGDHHLRLVVYPIIFADFFTFQVMQDFSHQQYGVGWNFGFTKRLVGESGEGTKGAWRYLKPQTITRS